MRGRSHYMTLLSGSVGKRKYFGYFLLASLARNLRRQPQDPSMSAFGNFAPAEGGEVVGNIWVNSTGVAKSVRHEQTRR